MFQRCALICKWASIDGVICCHRELILYFTNYTLFQKRREREEEKKRSMNCMGQSLHVPAELICMVLDELFDLK